MNPFSRGVRNAFRNSIRTLSIVIILGLSLGLSMSMLIAHQAVSDKINSVKANIGNTVNIQPAGFSGFSQVNNALSTNQLAKVKSVPHVTGVAENLTDRLSTTGSSTPSFGGRQADSSATTSLASPVTLNTGGSDGGGPRFFVNGGGSLPANFSLPISFLGTTVPTQVNGTSISITSGQVIDGSKDSNSVLVSSAMASKNNLKVGSSFTAYSTNLTVSGIFNSNSGSNRGADNTVVLSLPAEQRLSNQPGDVTSAVATVDSLDNLSSATTAIKNTLGSSADVVSSVDQANQAVQPLNSVKSISLYSLIGAVAAGIIIILMTMIMIVRERRREIGVLKAIGASNPKVMGQFMVEAVTFTGLAALVGIIFGVVAGNPITHLLVTNSASNPAGGPGGGFGRRGGGGFGLVRNNLSTIHAAVGWEIILFGLAAALVIALFGSALASYFIARIRPAEVMRVE